MRVARGAAIYLPVGRSCVVRSIQLAFSEIGNANTARSPSTDRLIIMRVEIREPRLTGSGADAKISRRRQVTPMAVTIAIKNANATRCWRLRASERTCNLADFPSETLAQFGIEAQHPDDFILDLLTLAWVGHRGCGKPSQEPEEPSQEHRRIPRQFGSPGIDANSGRPSKMLERGRDVSTGGAQRSIRLVKDDNLWIGGG